MTRDEFLALPPSLALAVLLDAAPGLVAKLADIPAPAVPKSPRFDMPIYKGGGIQWASETDVSGLSFWRALYQKDVDKGGEWLAKNTKRLRNIDAWLAWRRVEPAAQWSGERNDAAVTAAPPSSHPRLHPKRSGSSADASAESQPNGGSSADEPSDFNF